MRRALTIAATLSFLAASGLTALAEEATGVIASIDAASGAVTLEDGNTFLLPSVESAASLQVGQPVTIEYEQDGDGSLKAMSVTPQG